MENFEKLCRLMLENGFGRGDCVVAVGGGVPGDLAGFAASCYMRGVDFYNMAYDSPLSGGFVGRRKDCRRSVRY